MIVKVFLVLCLYLLALSLAIAPVSFIQLGMRADILPNLALCVVYFFAIYYVVGVLRIFIYGLFLSELYGYPLGLESLLFVIVYALCVKYKALLLSKQPLSLYAGFALVVVMYNLSKFMLLSLYYGHLFDYSRVAVQAAVTILFYPAVDFVMGRVRL